jgi:hypothetical protein
MYYTLETGIDWTHLQEGWVKNTKENFGSSKIYGSRKVRKPKDRRTDALTGDVIKPPETAGYKKYTLDRKIWRRKIGKSGA